MASTVKALNKKGLITPPKFLEDNVHYETIMGSMAYGVNKDDSDYDVYGFCIPPKDIIFPHLSGVIFGFDLNYEKFDQWQQHHIYDKETKKEYDFQIYNIVKFFRLAANCTPNIVDSLFTPSNCVLHMSRVGSIVRENRKLFLCKKIYHSYKGYAYQQLSKIRKGTNKSNPKRKANIQKHGYDCYSAESTKFLTDSGWKRFDNVRASDRLGTVDKDGNIEFQKYKGKIDKNYTGRLFTVEPYLSKCIITENHNLLVSVLHRNNKNNYSTEYDESTTNWELTPISDLISGYKSYYNYRKAGVSVRQDDHTVSDSFLILSGLYIGDGTSQFRNNKFKCICLSQVKPDNEFRLLISKLSEDYNFKKYEYKRETGSTETVWALHGEEARKLYECFGHGSKEKTLPNWAFNLSLRQVRLILNGLLASDGTKTPNGMVYYSTNFKLVEQISAMLTSVGILCSSRGPYSSISNLTNKKVNSYQLYVPNNQSKYHYLNFGRVLKEGNTSKKREGYPIKEKYVKNHRVVCFNVTNGTLITQNNGRVAIHGNCKFAYHLVRLLNQAEQTLVEGELDLLANRKQIMSVRNGEWTLEELENYFVEKEKGLEDLYRTSTALPNKIQESKIKQLLYDVLEEHYGSLSKCVVNSNKDSIIVSKIREILGDY